MSDEVNRLDRLESGLRETQDTILLMSKDMHSMNTSIQSIAESMKVLVEVRQDIALINERSESRHLQLKTADELLHSRIDKLRDDTSGVSKNAENGNRAYKILVQIAKWLGAGVVTLFLGLVIFLIQLKGS